MIIMKDDLISRQAAIDEIKKCRFVVDAIEKIIGLPAVDTWDIVKIILKELEQNEEKLYADYCDTTARLKAINKIAESSQTPKQKIDGIKPLAEMEVEE